MLLLRCLKQKIEEAKAKLQKHEKDLSFDPYECYHKMQVSYQEGQIAASKEVLKEISFPQNHKRWVFIVVDCLTGEREEFESFDDREEGIWAVNNHPLNDYFHPLICLILMDTETGNIECSAFTSHTNRSQAQTILERFNQAKERGNP